ncbi:hypothetical protein Prubr_38070 [Polymorphospora rubra]|uniref:Uncharacterized protein n=1 Tax=Polymorphospora rubra TaxID=338584 RepID=A0A810N059_9ACTN|nr:hypothetical protein Prubr_38070 [Polymorphospora rubra]
MSSACRTTKPLIIGIKGGCHQRTTTRRAVPPRRAVSRPAVRRGAPRCVAVHRKIRVIREYFARHADDTPDVVPDHRDQGGDGRRDLWSCGKRAGPPVSGSRADMERPPAEGRGPLWWWWVRFRTAAG